MSRSDLPVRPTAAITAALTTALLLAGAAAAEPSATEAAEPPAAVAVISQTLDAVIEVLNDANLTKEDRRSRIEEIAYDRFDFRTMSGLVVARYWKRFTPAQQEEFVREFKIFLARTYGERIDRYNQEQIEIVGERPRPRGDVSVLSRIVGGEYDDAEVAYRLRRTDGRWRVIDVKVEGISLVLNYRDQFKSLLSRGGPEGLIEKLRKKNAEGTVGDF